MGFKNLLSFASIIFNCSSLAIIKKMKQIILRNKRVIDKIKTETAVMKRVLSTVDSWCVTDGVRKEKERLTAVTHTK